MARANKRDLAVLALILIVASVLRLVGLNQPLWYDEVVTLYTHVRLPWSGMLSDYQMNHHYLYSLQAKFFVVIFGETPWTLRLPAVLFGIGSIWALWSLTRRIATSNIAHITALLVALSYHHIWFSQNARGYTELMFWSVVGTSLFIKAIRTGRIKVWVAYGIVLSLAVFTHLTGLFFFAAHGLVWLIWFGANLVTRQVSLDGVIGPVTGYGVGAIVTAILYAPLLGGIAENAATVSGTSTADAMVEYQNPIWTVLEAVRTLFGSLGPIISIIALAIIAFCVLGAWQLRKKEALVAPIVLVHIVLTMGILVVLGMRVWPRFFFVDIGFLMMLIVAGTAFLAERMPTFLPRALRDNAFAIGAVGMLLISGFLAAQNYRYPKQNLPGPMTLIAEQAEPGDTVYGVGFAGQLYHDHLAPDWNLAMTNADLTRALQTDGTLWLVVGFPARTFRAISELEAAVEAFELVERFPGTLGDGALLVYRRSK